MSHVKKDNAETTLSLSEGEKNTKEDATTRTIRIATLFIVVKVLDKGLERSDGSSSIRIRHF